MKTVDLERLGDQVAQLVKEAGQGEEIVIAHEGKPLARLVAVAPRNPRPRVLGRLAGQLNVPDNFDDPLPDDVLDSFEGR